MADFKDVSLREGLEALRFDLKDALLKVRQDRPIDMSGIDERVEYFCEEVIKQSPDVKDDIEPLMTEVISALEDLAHALNEAIDDDADDWDEDTPPENHRSH
jgi:hypothetical protein